MGMRRKSGPDLCDLMPSDALELLSASGAKLVHDIGLEVVRSVVYDILTGKNLRDSTELLTRRRIATLNLALVEMFVKGSAASSTFVEQLPELATRALQRKRIAKPERWLAQWMLGLTDKAFQNVLRDDPRALSDYRERYVMTCKEVIEKYASQAGSLSGSLELTSGHKAEINWLFLTYLLNAVGAETRVGISSPYTWIQTRTHHKYWKAPQSVLVVLAR